MTAEKKIRKVNGKARVLVVDDHPLIREGLRQMIELQPDLIFHGEAPDAQSAMAAVMAKRPDLVLLDLRLGNGDGLELIKFFRARFPELRILVVSQFDETIYAERTLRAGAHGYVMKEQPTSEVLAAIKAILSGQLYVGTRLAAIALHKMLETKPGNHEHPASGIEMLTDRELQIFHLLGAGLKAQKIAQELKLSVKTVETHRENIKHKLGFGSAVELAHHAVSWVQTNGQAIVSSGQLAG